MQNRIERGVTAPAPLLPDVGVLALIPDHWGGSWQPRQQILSRLCRYFHVVWVDPAPGWREELRTLLRGPQAEPVDSTVAPGLMIYRPSRFLPKIGTPPALGRFLERRRLKQARKLLVDRGCRKVVLYVWRPRFAEDVDLVDHDLLCYHIDDEYTFSPVEKPTSPQEAALIKRSDIVFIHSVALMEKKGHLNPRSVMVPNGVGYDDYASPVPEAADLRDIPHPRIGYVGIVKQQLDLALLLDLARRHKEWQFVLVGKQGSLGDGVRIVEELSRMPNVHLLGHRRINDLPSYTQYLDVCMLCYVVDDYTKFIYPLKLHEYLAAGRPVVGSPIRALEEFAGVVKIARSMDEWSRAITDSLKPEENSPQRAETRRAVARRFDWTHLAGIVARSLCETLGPEYAARLPQSVGEARH